MENNIIRKKYSPPPSITIFKIMLIIAENIINNRVSIISFLSNFIFFYFTIYPKIFYPFLYQIRRKRFE